MVEINVNFYTVFYFNAVTKLKGNCPHSQNNTSIRRMLSNILFKFTVEIQNQICDQNA